LEQLDLELNTKLLEKNIFEIKYNENEKILKMIKIFEIYEMLKSLFEKLFSL